MRQSVRAIDGIDAEPVRRMVEPRSGDERPRVLIADDDPSVVRLLADHCARLGFEVETASNGIQALLKAGRFRPDTLIIDVNMPEANGLSVCAHLLDPAKAPVNVIVISGGRDPDMHEKCEGFGAYYARKGPDFWCDLEAALTESHPHLASWIEHTGMRVPETAVRRRPRVLLVDDDDDVNRLLSSRLEQCGLEVRHASDAQQAVRIACRDEPSVIVTDFFMPNGDALYLLTRLRTTAETEKIPVIVHSGRHLEEATLESLKRDICGLPGAAQVLRKSENTHALFEILKKFCGFEQEQLARKFGQRKRL